MAAVEMAHPRRWRVLYDIRQMGVEVLTEANVESIEDDHVLYSHVEEGADSKTSRLFVDSVILTLGLTNNLTLANRIRAEGIEPICIGDCNGVGYIEGAITQGFQAALAIGES